MNSKAQTEASIKDIKIYKKTNDTEKVIALAGNPNVGKSTVFNRLTGMRQHTGNWPGKTVVNAVGSYFNNNQKYIIVDLPGTYSLSSNSVEEETARDFICFGDADAVAIVCDATCLERNINLALQTMEITSKVVVCVNLMDEARKKHIKIDHERLESQLGVPVIFANASKGKGVDSLINKIGEVARGEIITAAAKTVYPEAIETAISIIESSLAALPESKISIRWIALTLLQGDAALNLRLNQYFNGALSSSEEINNSLKKALVYLKEANVEQDKLNDIIASSIVKKAEAICKECIKFEKIDYNARDRKIDRILTSKLIGFPIMIALLFCVFWLTITGANYPSQLLAKGLFWIGDRLTDFLVWTGAPDWVNNVLIMGVYRVLAWVVSVMLPPMAIFFPLFTLLEDLGYLPRVAFNLDKSFKRCCACGKQALTMCMGFGCNAAGVIGCRIINSPRERLIAILTNSLVPCNGRFPTIIAIISMFLIGFAAGFIGSLLSALILTLVIVLGIVMTFLVSKFLSKTFLKGVPSSFTLELPPYRKPQIGKVIARSVVDRTLFVLGRAAMVAAPAGLIIWITANVNVNGISLLNHLSAFLDPFAHLVGLDGVILLAFILGFPANEIVIPIIIMAYMAEGQITEFESLDQLRQLLTANGWTWLTAICTILFSLFHWPCSTTCMTIYKETKSARWTALAFVMPTIIGLTLCFILTSAARLIGLI